MTKKQQRFLKHYLTRGTRAFLNATEAARQAGYSWPNKAGPRVARSKKIATVIEEWFETHL